MPEVTISKSAGLSLAGSARSLAFGRTSLLIGLWLAGKHDSPITQPVTDAPDTVLIENNRSTQLTTTLIFPDDTISGHQ